MAAYFIVHTTVHDAERFKAYRAAVMPLIAAFGGKLVVANGKIEVLEGHHEDARPTVVFEFPSMADIHAFWDSPDYVPIKEMRRGAATVDVWAVAGA